MRIFLAALFLGSVAVAQDWPQGSGPNGDFRTDGDAPTQWSVALDQNIVWKKTLPETGQSTVVIQGDRLFFTTMKEVEADSKIGKDIVAWCCDAETGRTLWKREIPGTYQTKLSGSFGDASAPSPVTDGERVIFVNPSGRIVCFDLDGEELWTREVFSVARTQPMILDGLLISHRQIYLPDDVGHFTNENAKAPVEKWTQLQAREAKSSKVRWTSECGVNMGSIPLPQQLLDGTWVFVVGRGGGHGPPEKPEGVSMIRADDGSTMWTLELPGFMSTQTYPVHNNQALVFHKGDHLWVNALTGKIDKTVSIIGKQAVDSKDLKVSASGVDVPAKKPRSIIQQSNLLVGKYHYFRSYTLNCIGRVDVESGEVRYLRAPLQALRVPGKPEQLLWDESQLPADREVTKKQKGAINYISFRPNSMKNSRGFVVMGDGRSVGNGWGHNASAIPTAIGDHVYFPMMNGTVFVVKAGTESFDEDALVSVNDLGPAGEAFTRSSISFGNGRVFARTIRELICIGE
ncbi:MAG: outer membrane protein assembly factor BamB [Verrucomicrobiales bacterium]|jgi:outer membrane protein assembly factor BamB